MTNTTEPKTGHAIPYFAEMLRYQAWIGMGKIANPQTQDIDRNMEAARMAIDLLSELETKTEGNRSEAESKLLQGVLTDLRLNYLDEEKKGAAEPEAAVDFYREVLELDRRCRHGVSLSRLRAHSALFSAQELYIGFGKMKYFRLKSA